MDCDSPFFINTKCIEDGGNGTDMQASNQINTACSFVVNEDYNMTVRLSKVSIMHITSTRIGITQAVSSSGIIDFTFVSYLKKKCEGRLLQNYTKRLPFVSEAE